MASPVLNITSSNGKKIYFASDFHLGAPTFEESLEREKKIVSWLNAIKKDAEHIFILGDIFDFWFEYKHTVPKGFIRLLGKLIEIRDEGIPVTFFTGNHDMWMFGYFEKEFNIKVFRNPVTIILNDKKCMVGHGDGLGPGDKTYKIIKKIFESRVARWFFTWLPSNIGFGLAHFWSSKSRNKNLLKDQEFMGEKEWLIRYCRKIEQQNHHDLYIFGHRHLPIEFEISDKSRYVNLGDWINSFTYGVLDGNDMMVKRYEE